ncbi:hypothetical protein FGG08_005499 [Glutinoglossum americanum]|uniref:Uncharacterized protein n=1 Tax=Glutinoglossum americanum TaxID=1670608 RepID=A0A9P8KVZ1_9PEZI|nr:hypothetical protein FGG08_005499 [Glutinoglossum americanum]
MSGKASYPKTYRVQGIPAESDGRLLLRLILGARDEPFSIGPDPQRSAFQVATITLGQVPTGLQDGRTEWAYNPPNGEIEGSSITVDSHFMGFTPLNSIGGGPDHKMDCIAITGLASHPFGSWKERDGEHMWLRDSLPQDLKGARILLYGYDTSLLHSQAFQGIDDIAVGLSHSIRSIRRNNKAIVHMKDGDEIDKENFNSIYGVIFFGVPNQGIRIEHWLPMVKGRPNENLVRNLGPDSTYLSTLHNEFRSSFCFPDSVIIAVYETERTKVAKEEEPGRWALTGNYEVLVSINQATDTLSLDQGPRYYRLPIKRNHSDMVKFSRQDGNYKLVVFYLEEFSAAAVEVIRARFMKAQEPTDTQGWTQLHHAASQGREFNLEESLKVLNNLANLERKDASDRTPLHLAAYYGHDSAVKALLDKGANRDSRNLSGQTPLYNAASRGYGPIVEALIDGGADKEARDNEGKTPLYAAARYGHGAVTRLLAGRGANKEARANGDWTPLHAAAWYGHEAVVGLLIEGGADRGATSGNGKTPLHAAVQNGHEAVTLLLLNVGAHIEAKTDSGDTPLHVAAYHGLDAVARVLVDRRANREATNNEGKTPLYIAAREGHERVARLLLQRGTNWKVRIRGGWSPLHAAAWYGHESTVRALVEYAADTELRNDKGETPLFAAARRGHENVVRLLLENGADKKARANNKWTPLKVAESNGYRVVAGMLKRSW